MRTGKRWTILTKLPVAFCGGKQGERLTGPHREAGDAALELAAAAVHVHLAAHALADAQVRQLRFLEVGVDPDLRQRANGHQALSDLDVVAGVDVAARHHAVDLADDVAVAEIQLGLIQIAAGLLQFGLRLLDGGRIGNDMLDRCDSDCPRGLACRTPQWPALGVAVHERREVTELGRALDQFSQRLADRGEVLVEIARAHPSVSGLWEAGQEDPG